MNNCHRQIFVSDHLDIQLFQFSNSVLYTSNNIRIKKVTTISIEMRTLIKVSIVNQYLNLFFNALRLNPPSKVSIAPHIDSSITRM